MSPAGNRIYQILQRWQPNKDSQHWVLGIVMEIRGSSYRKPGAMMLFGEYGEQYGLLSGGCLEADLMRHARMVMDNQQAKYVVYDMTDEDDVGWQLGIGCGGMVKVLLLPLTNQPLKRVLENIHTSLCQGRAGLLSVPFDESEKENICWLEERTIPKQTLERTRNEIRYLELPLKPSPSLVIFGGGIDAVPLVSMALNIGWQVSIVDKRAAYARESVFAGASIYKVPPEDLSVLSLLGSVDAAVVMNHNLIMDSESLFAISKANLKYIALLGPNHRRDKVLAMKKLNIDDFSVPLSSPAGLAIGGEIPESIALSILSEGHAVIEGGIALENLAFKRR